MAQGRAGSARAVDSVRWSPPHPYTLALEVMRVAELRQRGSAQHFERPQRMEFFSLLGVTEGTTLHTIDFAEVPARPGTWLLLRPGQIQRYDFRRDWDGWDVVFRPDLLPPHERRRQSPFHTLSSQLGELPSVTWLAPAAHAQCCALVQQMRADAALPVSESDRNALMLYQVCTLLTRLKLAGAPDERAAGATAPDRERVLRLRQLVDEHFRSQHSLGWYAQRLGCTVKTLGRSTLAVSGQAGKALLRDRITIEAQRQLVHSRQAVQAIAADLGFTDASNFVTFFKREAGCTPTAFRQRHTAGR